MLIKLLIKINKKDFIHKKKGGCKKIKSDPKIL